MNSVNLHSLRRGICCSFVGFSFEAPLKVAVLFAVGLGLVSCGSTPKTKNANSKAHINNKTKFSERVFGVKASPRVTTSRQVRRGGGRAQIGKPYKVRGKWYRPREQPGYDKIGNASWYGPNFHGRLTANGEVYDQYSLSGAHPTFPLPSYARVTNLANGNSVVVRVNDRGPYAHGRVIDMSSKAADLLDYKRQGIARVRVQYLGKARLDGRDQRFLVASFKPGKGYRGKRPATYPGKVPDVMIASKRPQQPVGQVPVFSFVKAPFPKPRPVFSGGIPVNIQAFIQPQSIVQPAALLSAPSRFDQSAPIANNIHKANVSRTRLESLSPAISKSLKDRYLISSYAAGLRIKHAHNAASLVIDQKFESSRSTSWKVTPFRRSW